MDDADMVDPDSEPFFGLSDFLRRHAVPDNRSSVSCGKIFVAYRTYMAREQPGLIIRMDFARFRSYFEHLAERFNYNKTVNKEINSTLYHLRFREFTKLEKKQNPETQQKDLRIPLRDINVNICCKVCCGYLVDASTITECLHTFCRSCIVKHFYTSPRCPVCNLMIHEMTPMAFVKRDVVLQDIVKKLLPGIEKCEQKREGDFFEHYTPPEGPPYTPMKLGNQYKPIRFILEWVGLKHCSLMAEQIPDKFIQVSNQATVGHVSQFVLQKLKNLDGDSKPTVQCDIKSGGVALPPILALERIEKHGLNFEMKKGWLLLQYDIKPLEE